MEKINKFRLYTRWLIVTGVLLRVVCAFCINLGNDEVYYYTYALQPDWNHFDHPPAVGFLIRFFTLNLHWVNTFSMRTGAIACSAVATWLISVIGRNIKNERTGFIVATLYTASIYTSIISGLFILPDSPAVVCWLSAIYCLIFLLKEKDNRRINKYLLLLGIWIGLATLCKVHGLFLWVGFGVYILIYDRRWLLKWGLYFSLLITALLISPIVIWNVQNDFITWNFHSGRVSVGSTGIRFSSFFTALAGTVFYNNPFNIILFLWCGRTLIKRRHFMYLPYEKILLCCGMPIICATFMISLFRDVLPHWSGPGSLSIMLLTAVWMDKKIVLTSRKTYIRFLKFSCGFIVFALIAGVIAINYTPGTLGKKTNPALGAGDFTLDMYGWNDLAARFDSVRQKDIGEKRMDPDAPLIVNKWFPGGHILFYVARPLQIKTIGLGTVNDLHKFVWLNKDQGRLEEGNDAYFIAPSNYFSDPVELYANDFSSIEKAGEFPQYRGGAVARFCYVYRLKGYKSR